MPFRIRFWRVSRQKLSRSKTEEQDQVADSFDLSIAVLIAAEGAIMGVAASVCELIPGAQIAILPIVMADLMASMTFLSRHSSQVAASYGFPASDPVNIGHIIASMVPQNQSEDEGFMSAEAAAIYEIREAGYVSARRRSLTQWWSQSGLSAGRAFGEQKTIFDAFIWWKNMVKK